MEKRIFLRCVLSRRAQWKVSRSPFLLKQSTRDTRCYEYTEHLIVYNHLGRGEAGINCFLPGFLGSHATWNTDFQALSSRYRLIFMDTLGFGCSPKPDIEYSLTDHLSAIRYTLHSLNIQKAHFVGHSMGSLLALAYACHFPEAVEKLMLLALSVYSSEEEARRTVGSTSLLTRLVALDTPLAKTLCEMMCATRPLLMLVAPLLAPDVPPPLHGLPCNIPGLHTHEHCAMLFLPPAQERGSCKYRTLS